MADPPPVDASDHPRPITLSPADPPLPKSSDMKLSGDPISPSMAAAEPPLPESAEMELSGEPMSVSMAVAEPNSSSESAAASSMAPPSRPSMVAHHLIIKKKKSAAKSHPYLQLSHEEINHQNLKESAFEARGNLNHRESPVLGMDDGGPRTDLATIVQPLQSVAAEDVSPFDGDDVVLSDDEEEEEEEFDFESFYVDKEKRAELRSLMERYDVYDEEQLRLAIRRERKHGLNLPELAGNSSPPSASLPASPTHPMSRYIPPPPNKSTPILGEIPSTILAGNKSFLVDSPAQPLVDNSKSMHPIPNPMHAISTPMQVTPIPMQAIATPMQLSPTPMQITIMHGHTPPQPNPNPMQHSPNPMHTPPQSTDASMHNSPKAMHSPPQSESPTYTPFHDTNPYPPTQPGAQSGLTRAQPTAPLSNSELEDPGRSTVAQGHEDHDLKFFSNNPLAKGDLTDFPPLPRNPSVHGKGGDTDIVMASAEEGEPRQVSPSSSAEQARTSSVVSAHRPPTSLAEGQKLRYPRGPRCL